MPISLNGKTGSSPMADFLTDHDGRCQLIDAEFFSVCDTDERSPACIGECDFDRGCRVSNPQRRALVFRPVDRALYSNADSCRCDALLRTEDMSQFFFIELKDWNAPGWYKHGVEQVAATIDDFNAAHPGVLMSARKRAAYVVNIRRKGFSRAHSEIMRNFVRSYHVVLRETQPVLIG